METVSKQAGSQNTKRQLVFVVGDHAAEAARYVREAGYERVMVACTFASAVEQATKLQPAVVIPGILTLTTVSDRLRIKAESKAYWEKNGVPLDDTTEGDRELLEERLQSWISTLTTLLIACPKCKVICPEELLTSFPLSVRKRLVGAGRLWGDEVSVLISRIERLIGPPAQRTDEEAARDAVHALYVLRSIDDQEARSWAVDELGNYCSEIQRAILLAAKTDRSDSIRLAAAEYLSAAALFPADVVPVLVTALDESLKCWTKMAEFCANKKKKFFGSSAVQKDIRNLASYGKKAVSAVPHLVKALAFPDADVVREAAKTLGEIGAGAAEALAALERIATDPEHPAAHECGEAAGKIRS